MVAASAAVAETAAWAMKSRRFRGGVMTSVSPVPMVQIERIMSFQNRSTHRIESTMDRAGHAARHWLSDSNPLPTVLP